MGNHFDKNRTVKRMISEKITHLKSKKTNNAGMDLLPPPAESNVFGFSHLSHLGAGGGFFYTLIIKLSKFFKIFSRLHKKEIASRKWGKSFFLHHNLKISDLNKKKIDFRKKTPRVSHFGIFPNPASRIYFPFVFFFIFNILTIQMNFHFFISSDIRRSFVFQGRKERYKTTCMFCAQKLVRWQAKRSMLRG